MAKKRLKKWIQQAIERPGALTRKAKAAGMTVAAFIANPPKNISTETRRQINLAKTLKKLGRRRKKG
jgi:transposase-like protein